MDGLERDRRRSQRKRVFRGAQISYFGLVAPIECVVRDQSDTGVRVKVDHAMRIPEIFDLAIGNGPFRRYRIVWREESAIGAEYVPETGAGPARR